MNTKHYKNKKYRFKLGKCGAWIELLILYEGENFEKCVFEEYQYVPNADLWKNEPQKDIEELGV